MPDISIADAAMMPRAARGAGFEGAFDMLLRHDTMMRRCRCESARQYIRAICCVTMFSLPR